MDCYCWFLQAAAPNHQAHDGGRTHAHEHNDSDHLQDGRSAQAAKPVLSYVQPQAWSHACRRPADASTQHTLTHSMQAVTLYASFGAWQEVHSCT
jgi:hypothetical protein